MFAGSRRSDEKVHPSRYARWACEVVYARWAASRALVRQFREGASQLLRDVRLAWRHRKLTRGERAKLRPREATASRRAFGDLARMVPLLFNPLPPPLGLVLIAVAYSFPRALLSPQFHTSEQAEAFARQDAATQLEAASELRRSLLRSHATLLTDVASLGPATPVDRARRVLQCFDTGPLSLSALKRPDLVRLATIAAPRSLKCYPNSILRTLVENAAKVVEEDDAILLASLDGSGDDDASATLSGAQVRDACVLRSLHGDDQPGHRLRAWLVRAAAIRAAWRRDLPPAFLFVAAALCNAPNLPPVPVGAGVRTI
ncbi:hypothetical protein CTAYLR_008345 [Chrysophaeum taylorii]|uniref:Letm1 RBD domain-containing protein n=1 Tax=Chrysophaeum taylorii TaxID=2483200 RepID=A0AAD7XNQ9_9STRA|nr:hypothetical protein CTAYLR_008345 [Chrysophaeum taylorii]